MNDEPKASKTTRRAHLRRLLGANTAGCANGGASLSGGSESTARTEQAEFAQLVTAAVQRQSCSESPTGEGARGTRQWSPTRWTAGASRADTRAAASRTGRRHRGV